MAMNSTCMSNNLTIASWNINGLGDKCRDDFFISCINYDINILLETWKGTDNELNMPDFNVLQKCRKKKRRSRRFSGGIIICYKSKLHNGITELNNITTSLNRLWFKLDKQFFGLEKDLYVCACYIPPSSSPYYDDDFQKLENEILNISDKGDVLIVGDLNARVANKLDFIDNEDRIHDNLLDILPTDYIHDYYLNRNSIDTIFNSQGQQLLDLCIASQLRILNGRFLGDALGNMTCFKPNGASTVDYALASVGLMKAVNYFQTLNPSYLSDHVQIVVHLKCNLAGILEPSNDLNSNKINSSYKWENISKEKMLIALEQNDVKESIINFENTSFTKDNTGIEMAGEQLNDIFQTLSSRSCKLVKLYKKKKETKKEKTLGGQRITGSQTYCISYRESFTKTAI